MDIRKIMGINARRYRRSLGLSQEAVAVRMGADRAYVSAIERGIQNLTLLRLRELAEALGVKAAELLDENYAASAISHGQADSS